LDVIVSICGAASHGNKQLPRLYGAAVNSNAMDGQRWGIWQTKRGGYFCKELFE
jgi:hypothetical protein